MCLYNPSKKMIAQKDMIVFKKGTNENEGRFQADQRYYFYNLGKEAGYVGIEARFSEVNSGYHSWKNFWKGNAVFLIPEGSEYYEGEQYDGAKGYVSSNIVYISPGSLITKILYKLGIITPKYVKEKEEN